MRLQTLVHFSIVLEGIPAQLASEITAELDIPTIGIGAGLDCNGQVLVLHDMLGLTVRESGKEAPRFVREYENLAERVSDAVSAYLRDVRNSDFPGDEHSYQVSQPKLTKVQLSEASFYHRRVARALLRASERLGNR